MSVKRARSRRVDVLAYPGCFGAELFGVVDLLTIANAVSTVVRPGAVAPFKVRVVTVRGSRVRLAGGAAIQAERVDPGDPPDQIVVPGFEFVDPAELDGLLTSWAPEVTFLRKPTGRSVAIASICVGAFLLGEAGLLDGRAATTSWLFAPALARRYPKADVRATAMVLQDGRISTAAAFSAFLDLGLRLIGQHAGDAVAQATSRLTLSPLTRSSQSPFVDEDLVPVRHARFSDDVRDWLRHRLDEPYELGRLATAFNVSPRTLLRRFSAETGESPLAFLQHARIVAAKRLLESSDLSVSAILGQVGYRDAATFRRLFVNLIGVTPSEYRRQFQAPSA